MSSLREYFLTEASEYLDRLDALAQQDQTDPAELLRLTRALRGSAQMAREERVRQVAGALESAAREMVAGTRPWSSDLKDRLGRTVDDLRRLAEGGEQDAAGGRLAQEALERWREVAVQAGAGDETSGTQASAGGARDPELRAYVEAEVRGILSELERAIPALTRSPMGRDPLKSILRAQRSLLGVAGLGGFPVLSEALRTVEDATRAIARQNAPVDGDRLALYKQAHAVLLEGVQALARGEEASADAAELARLRSLRDSVVSDASVDTPFRPPAAPAGDEPVEVVNFFQTESTKLLDRIERMAGAFAAATDQRKQQLRGELRDAFNALRDTSRTFGFEEPARSAEQALSKLRDGSAMALLGLVEQLRDVVAEVGAEVGLGTSETASAGEVEVGPSSEGTAATLGEAVTPQPETASAQQAGAVADAQESAASVQERVAAAGAARKPGAAAAGAADAPEQGTEAEVVPIETLLYSGDAALERALELRQRVEAAAGDDEDAREAVAELFDLVRLAMS